LKVSHGTQNKGIKLQTCVCVSLFAFCFYLPADNVSACERWSFWRFLQIMHKAGSTGPAQATGRPVLDLSVFVGH